MATTPSGLSVEEAEALSKQQQDAIAATMPKENELVSLSIGEGAYKIGVQQGNTINWIDTGEFWPKGDWQGRTIGSWVGSGVSKVLAELGNPEVRELNAADYASQKFNETTLSSADFLKLAQLASQQPLGTPLTTTSNNILGSLISDTGAIAPENSIAGIQSVFGSQWQPSPAFTPELQAQGIFGAVRIAGTNEVYTLGPGGTKETAESFLQKFGTSEQKGIVGEITKEQAIKLGITDTKQTPVAPTGAITSDALSNTESIDLTGGTTGGEGGTTTYTADTQIAGLEEYLKLQESLKSQSEKDREAKVDTLTTQIETLLGESEGRGAAQLTAEEEQGVKAKQQAVDDANGELQIKLAEINSLTASYNLENQIVEGKTITLGRQQGQQAQNYKMYLAQKNLLTSEATLLQAQALGLQGKLDSAQAAADRAIDLKYSDIETRLNNQLTLLNLLQGQLDKDEQTRADALAYYYDQQKTALADQKQAERDITTTLLDQIQKYPDAGIQLTDTLEEANRKIAANSKIYQQQTRLATPTSTSTTISPTTNYRDVLYNVGLPVNVATTSGELTKGNLDKLVNAGLPQDTAQGIYDAIIQGYTLEEIRQYLRDNGVDPVILDTFMQTLQGITGGDELDNLIDRYIG